MNGAASTGDCTKLILAIKIVYSCCAPNDIAIFEVFNLEVGLKWQKQAHAQKILTNAQSVILTTKFSSVISDNVSEIIDFNGLCNSNSRRVRN